MSRYEMKLKDTSDGEIKLAGLEALCLGTREAFDTQLKSLANVRGRPHGNRDACGGEVWLEKSAIPSGANREFEDTGIQWMLTRSTNFSCILHGKTKRFISPREGYFECGGNHIQRDCPALATPRNGNGNGKKCKQSKFWFKGAGKGKSKEGERDGQFKGTPWVPRVPNVRTKVRVRKLVCPVWKTHSRVKNAHRRTTPTILTYTEYSRFFDDWRVGEWK